LYYLFLYSLILRLAKRIMKEQVSKVCWNTFWVLVVLMFIGLSMIFFIPFLTDFVSLNYKYQEEHENAHEYLVVYCSDSAVIHKFEYHRDGCMRADQVMKQSRGQYVMAYYTNVLEGFLKRIATNQPITNDQIKDMVWYLVVMIGPGCIMFAVKIVADQYQFAHQQEENRKHESKMLMAMSRPAASPVLRIQGLPNRFTQGIKNTLRSKKEKNVFEEESDAETESAQITEIDG